jgi:hypothetical protein
LEAIFNSGMVNPPRDEIPRIRLRLQEYGPVGDANVFYWFQNRKARSKNKRRAGGSFVLAPPAPSRAPRPARQALCALVTPPSPPQIQTQLLAPPMQKPAPTSSSSSSSDHSSGSSKPAAGGKPAAAHAMSATEGMDLLGPLAAACPQVYYRDQQQVAPAPKVVQDHTAADETIFLPWPQGYCLSAAELAAILGAQYVQVPVQQQQQQPQAVPAGPFLGLCNEVLAPTINTGHWSCASRAQGLGHCWPLGAADHHQLCKNTTASNTDVTKEVAHEDATKPGLLQYDFGVSAGMDAVLPGVTLPILASPVAAVTVASVAAATAGLTGGLAAANAANVVVTNYDQFQGM